MQADLVFSCINNCFEQIYDFLLFKENIALGKPAYQQSQYIGNDASLAEASNAVDGLKSNLSYWGGQCAYSDYDKQTATWWVNLTSILSIHYVTIYYLTENAPWGMQLIINILCMFLFQSSLRYMYTLILTHLNIFLFFLKVRG